MNADQNWDQPARRSRGRGSFAESATGSNDSALIDADMRWVSPGSRVMALSAALAVSMQSICCQSFSPISDIVFDFSIQGFQTTVVAELRLSILMQRLAGGSKIREMLSVFT